MEAEEDLWAHSMEDAEFQQYLAEALATGAAEYSQKQPVSNQGKGRAPGVGQTYEKQGKQKQKVGDLGF